MAYPVHESFPSCQFSLDNVAMKSEDLKLIFSILPDHQVIFRQISYTKILKSSRRVLYCSVVSVLQSCVMLRLRYPNNV